jgi:alkaline phosphatase D
MLSRRDFIALGTIGALSPQVLSAQAPGRVFQHGVASGDPLQDRVVLWTRVTVPGPAAEGRWLVAEDPRLTRVVARGTFATAVTRDFTVKIDAGGLAAGRTYYYAFEAGGERSPIGRTRTLPSGRVDAFRMALATCASYPHGYYNAYAHIAARADLDLVLHVGDYIYEYQRGEYVSPLPAVAAARAVLPMHELLSLADYRTRYSLYRRDPDLQEMHRQHAFVCVWDDHESANDAWREGAENHQPERDEGDWGARKRGAIHAFHEWMPIRDTGTPERIYRGFRIGELADLVMLDTRLIGRDRQVPAKIKGTDDDAIAVDDPRLSDPSRTLLGAAQEAWLEREIATSVSRGARWQFLGQQVMMAQLSASRGRTIRNADQWDGYPAARARLFESLRRHRASAVVMAGDFHASFASELAADPWGASAPAESVAVEFLTPAISSGAAIPDPARAAAAAADLLANSPHVKYADFNRRGYTLLDVRPDRVQGEIWHVDTVERRVAGEALASAYVVERGRAALMPTTTPSGPTRTPDPAPG